MVRGWVGHTVTTGTPYFGHAPLFYMSHPIALQVHPRRGDHYFASKFAISGSFLMTSLFSRPRSIDDPPTKVVTINVPFVAHLGSALSAFFTTLEDIFIPASDPIDW